MIQNVSMSYNVPRVNIEGFIISKTFLNTASCARYDFINTNRLVCKRLTIPSTGETTIFKDTTEVSHFNF